MNEPPTSFRPGEWRPHAARSGLSGNTIAAEIRNHEPWQRDPRDAGQESDPAPGGIARSR
jgi:hypothetical protein